MRYIICGDRNWKEELVISLYIHHLPRDSYIITGGCRGADNMANSARLRNGMKGEVCKADWTKYGNSAGPIRNKHMLSLNPDLVVAFHDDIENSKGTKDMVRQARLAGVHVEIRGSVTKVIK